MYPTVISVCRRQTFERDARGSPYDVSRVSCRRCEWAAVWTRTVEQGLEPELQSERRWDQNNERFLHFINPARHVSDIPSFCLDMCLFMCWYFKGVMRGRGCFSLRCVCALLQRHCNVNMHQQCWFIRHKCVLITVYLSFAADVPWSAFISQYFPSHYNESWRESCM